MVSVVRRPAKEVRSGVTGVFGSRARVPRPVLFVLVYGVFLVIVGITAAAQTTMVSTAFSATTLESVVSTDAALVRSVVNTFLRADDLDPATLTAVRRAEIEANLSALVRRAEVMRIELRRPDGLVIVGDLAGLGGLRITPSTDFRAAVESRSIIAGINEVSLSEASGPPLGTSSVLREYLPLEASGRVHAVVALWRDAVPVLAKLDQVRRDIVITTVTAGIVAALVLFMVFRTAQARITRQTAALLESTRLDPLTGLLNHGSLVDELALAVEVAREEQRAIGVALVDIDGFRLLNETFGHAAGDRALMTVVSALRIEIPETMIWGRYGPDEFLVIAPAAHVSELRPMLERVRASLVDGELQFDASERLPVTVSAGICIYPEHAASVTALLTTAALTLQEARSGGGDAIRFAGQAEIPEEAHTFDVFQGLILAVDSKDRYTKRHSEDVARYAVFLGQLAGLDEATIQTLKAAGLLHDVGKIGIPDRILRKPGKLTSDEYRTVQQHVALGDTIIRDLPSVDLIRAGVRHHHERWDGGGYLHGLAGEEIPLIARILAIGDAFSAMTTTRPYRKALSIGDALRRLEDAAGTQLDAKLVTSFVAGIEAEPDGLMQAGESPVRFWTPYTQVA